jgi:hypothetical protein
MPRKLTFDEFVSKAKKIHGDKYDYSKVNYINAKNKVCIVCNKHGKFFQEAFSHLNGCGCKECSKIKIGDRLRSNISEFIKNLLKFTGINMTTQNLIIKDFIIKDL